MDTEDMARFVSRAWEAERFNPYHAPAGTAAGGQFAPAPAGKGGQAATGKGKPAVKDTRGTPGNKNPVGYGERGQRVSDLQKRLNALGIKPPLAVDGIFGPKTRAAVLAFQKQHGLKPDGLVGPKTTAALRAPAKSAAGKPAAKVPAKPAAKPPAKPAAKVPAARPAPAAKPAVRALAHEKVGHTDQGLWHHKNMQLPAFIQHVANDLRQERGMDESQAIATAISKCRQWAAGGADTQPETRAKAAAALAEWERLKAQAKVSRAMGNGEYDSDGLDASWDPPVTGLPDLTGLGVADFDDGSGDGGEAGRAAPLGSGARFAALKAELAAKGASDPGALAAYIGRRKLGKAKFQGLAAAAARGGGGGSASRSVSPAEIFRFYPLEDCQIITRAQGDGSGTLVEAYATVFDTPAEIRDHQGHYQEIIDRTAFDATLERIRRSRGGLKGAVKVLYNHGKTASGTDAPEYQVPLGVPEEITAERRGLLTRTRYDAGDPFTERILAKIRSGAINAQSFVGAIMRSDPALMGPGDRYRKRGGTLQTVRRMQLGLREYGPVLWPAYSGAEILGVRMQLPGDAEDLERYDEDPAAEPDSPDDAEYDLLSSEEDLLAVAGAAPGEADASRSHQHALYRIRSREIRDRIGLDW